MKVFVLACILCSSTHKLASAFRHTTQSSAQADVKSTAKVSIASSNTSTGKTEGVHTHVQKSNSTAHGPTLWIMRAIKNPAEQGAAVDRALANIAALGITRVLVTPGAKVPGVSDPNDQRTWSGAIFADMVTAQLSGVTVIPLVDGLKRHGADDTKTEHEELGVFQHRLIQWWNENGESLAGENVLLVSHRCWISEFELMLQAVGALPYYARFTVNPDAVAADAIAAVETRISGGDGQGGFARFIHCPDRGCGRYHAEGQGYADSLAGEVDAMLAPVQAALVDSGTCPDIFNGPDTPKGRKWWKKSNDMQEDGGFRGAFDPEITRAALVKLL